MQITENLKNPQTGDRYLWKKENIYIVIYKTGLWNEITEYHDKIIITSMSEDYEFQNILETDVG